jgi:prepilin-type N-terminal cleavage/methylation domain-containing protein
MNNRLYGFSLVEMAVVLVIIGLLMSGLMVPLSSQLEYQKIEITQQRLEDIKEALLGFGAAQGYLPCPTADDKTGQADPSRCIEEGFLPWATLGLDEARKDGWGRYFRYRVDENFGGDVDIDFTNVTTENNLIVTNKMISGKTLEPVELTCRGADNSSQVIAIVFSYGKDNQANNINDPSNVSDAAISYKCNDSTQPDFTYAQDSYINAPEAPNEHFDDILTWLPKSIFVSRLALAGQWP